MSNTLKMGIREQIISPTLFPIASIGDEILLRYVISTATISNTVVFRARIIGQDDWDTLVTVIGNGKGLINIHSYDEIQVECTSYSTSDEFVKVVVSSFNEAAGATSIGAPSGGTATANTVNLISSDNSVSIVANPVTNSIDLTTSGGGGSVSKYTAVFTTGTWLGPVDDEYFINFPFILHNKANPVVTCYEEVDGEFESVMVSIVLDNNDVKIITLSSPDTRFSGKVFIE